MMEAIFAVFLSIHGLLLKVFVIEVYRQFSQEHSIFPTRLSRWQLSFYTVCIAKSVHF